MAPHYHLYVGVDIAAKTFVATWAFDPATTPKPVSFQQTEDGFTAFREQLGATGVTPNATLVVMEATGSYWVALAIALHQADYVVSVINPGQVALFARSLPRRGKTDVLDAQLLVRFAAARQPAAWRPPEQVYHELRQRLVVRDGLLHMRTQAKNQRHAMEQWPVQIAAALEALDTVIADLDAQVASLERAIAEVLRDGAWASSATVLLTAPGIGLITTGWLLVGTLNVTVAQSPEQLTAYAGLAPLERQSGTSLRGRPQIGHAGNGRLRTALYMATLAGARYNPSLRAFYQRLRTAGKPTKVARCATARTLLHLAWAMVKKNEPYRAPAPEQPEQQAV
jgi:transposase